MNIYILSREYPPITIGGTSTVAKSLAEGLAKIGEQYNVVVITSHKGTEDYLEKINNVNIIRVGNKKIYSETTKLDSNNLASHRRFLNRIHNMIERYGQPSIIFLPDLFCFPEAYIIAKRYNVPLINILLQDFRAMIPYDRGDKHKVSNGVEANREEVLQLEEKSLRLSTHTIFISHSLSDKILSYYSGSFNTSVIYLGITPEELLPRQTIDYQEYRQRITKDNQKIIIACGRLVPVKGFDYLIRSFKEVLNHNNNVSLAIIGVGPEEEYLKSLANNLKIGKNVIFMGDISREEALIYFHTANIAIVPSLWESFCYVCAEFMGIGKPIVVSSVDSLNELIPSNEYGIKIDVSIIDGKRVLDEKMIANAILEYLEFPDRAEVVAAKAQERALSFFTNGKFIEGISNVMENYSLRDDCTYGRDIEKLSK